MRLFLHLATRSRRTSRRSFALTALGLTVIPSSSPFVFWFFTAVKFFATNNSSTSLKPN